MGSMVGYLVDVGWKEVGRREGYSLVGDEDFGGFVGNGVEGEDDFGSRVGNCVTFTSGVN